jgi:outer membrane protein
MIPLFKAVSTDWLKVIFLGMTTLIWGFFMPVYAESPPVPPDRSLSLNDCIKIALETNPLQQVAAQNLQTAREIVGEARAPYYPELGLQARYAYWQQRAFLPKDLAIPGRPLPKIIGPTDDWMAGLRVRYTLFDSGERRAQYHSALARQGVAEEEKARITQDLVLGVYQGYYGLAAALETLGVAEKSLARAKDHLRLAQERKAAGAVSQADVLRVQVETANAELALVRAENLVRISRGGLNTVMGLPAEKPLLLEVRGDAITAPDFPDLSTALNLALHHRPEIKAALKRIEALKGGVEAAKSTFGPKVRAEGSYGRRDTVFFPQDDEWLAGVSIEWPLFTGFFREHRLARAKTEVSREEAEVRQLLLKVRQEVWTACSRIKETYEAVQTTKVTVVDAQESLRLSKERYEAGAGTVTDLLDSQTALARAQANQVEAEWDYHTAQVVFKRSIGSLEEKIRP